MVRVSLFLLAVLCFSISVEALAQSSLDLRGDVGGSGIPGGSIIPGWDNRACDGTIVWRWRQLRHHAYNH